MKNINTRILSTDECWSIQINGFDFCSNCKFVNLSACAGQNIHKTGYNSKGYKIGKYGIIESSRKHEVY